jgi:hypothetical protein
MMVASGLGQRGPYPCFAVFAEANGGFREKDLFDGNEDFRWFAR